MRLIVVLLVLSTLFHGDGWAEIYKYKAADGTMVFTDDVSRIPADQRPKAEMMPQIVESKSATELHENSIKTNLSWEDMDLVNILKQKGVIENDMNEEEITPEYLAYIQLVLKEEVGIDDIRTWQPDGRLSSPEDTFRLYKQSLITHDVDLLLKCLMPQIRALHQKVFESVEPEKLRQMGEGMSPIQKITAESNNAKYRIRRKEEHNGQTHDITYYIYFTNVLGEWRISQF